MKKIIERFIGKNISVVRPIKFQNLFFTGYLEKVNETIFCIRSIQGGEIIRFHYHDCGFLFTDMDNILSLTLKSSVSYAEKKDDLETKILN